MRAAGLILAAGESRRMGRPKALVELEGRSFLAHGVELLREGGCFRVLVVDGAHPLPSTMVEALGAERVHNSRWPLGPLASLQAGLRAALVSEPELELLVVHHIERPRIRPQTIARLIAVSAGEPGCLWQPTHGGRSGHPMVWPRALFPALATLDPEHDTARTLVRGEAAGLRRKLEVEDPGVLENLDRPDLLPPG